MLVFNSSFYSLSLLGISSISSYTLGFISCDIFNQYNFNSFKNLYREFTFNNITQFCGTFWLLANSILYCNKLLT